MAILRKKRKIKRKTTKRKTVKRKTTKKKTVKKKVVKKKRKANKKAFGTYRIRPDATLAAVVGTKKPLKPSEMTKLIWKYIKKKKLGSS